MAYAEPTISASGQSFANLQDRGLDAFTQAVAAGSSPTAAETELVGKLLNPQQATQAAIRLRNIVDGYLRGDPVAVATVDTELVALAFAYKTVLTAISEIGALVDANTGTVSYTGMTTGIGMGHQVRTF